MKITKNLNKVQKIQRNQKISALALAYYLKDNTFLNWNQMKEVWIDGYKDFTPKPRRTNSFPGMQGGGIAFPENFRTTLQYLVDMDLMTCNMVNGFICFSSTKKLKSIDFYYKTNPIFLIK